MLWLCGGSLALCLVMVFGLLLLVFTQGFGTFWPTPLVQLELVDGTVRLGEVTRASRFEVPADQLAALPEATRQRAQARLQDGWSERRQLRTGNYDLTFEHFHWVPEYLVDRESQPEWAVLVERRTWGRFYGTPIAFKSDAQVVATEPAAVLERLFAELPATHQRFAQAAHLRKHEIGRLSDREEEARLAARAVELRHGTDSTRHVAALADLERLVADTAAERARIEAEVQQLESENRRRSLVLRTSTGAEHELSLDAIVRLYPANRLTFGDKLAIYLDRWHEFLFDDPRESNTEGGVWPAIFGTVLMTLIMSLLVVPFGVLAALYMREYAKAGLVISAVRIAVNNLAGVPSIVFGVFGLGFFCYIIGGTIDDLFYPERQPAPTFGKGALIWASLTLALLTLPVVIVATEEALAAVPSSMREGSYACGASKWQTIRRIVLPRALPGIMTGAILAMARGAGEVAPLMLVGAVKLAPELPLDGEFPFLHPSRSFMHLGFHVFDLGFQSQNSEAAKPMVFTTTLLLIGVITTLNVTAIWLRSRLRRRFVSSQF